MANSNFVVHNGLTVGPTTIDAASGNLTLGGSLITTGSAPFGVVAPSGGNGFGQIFANNYAGNIQAYVIADNTFVHFGSYSNTQFNLKVNGQTPAYINTNGSVVVSGATSLNTAGYGNVYVTNYAGNNTAYIIADNNFTHIGSATNTQVNFKMNGTTPVFIGTSGNLVIATATTSTSNTTGAIVTPSIGVSGNVNANAYYSNYYLYSNGAPITTPAGGANTMVQFNDGTNFNGATYLQYNKTSGNLVSNSTTTSTSTTTGAIVVGGGVGIGGNLFVGGSLSVGGNTTFINTTTITTTDTIAAPTINAGTIGNSGAVLYGTLNSSSASQTNITSVGTLTSLTVSGTTNLQGTTNGATINASSLLATTIGNASSSITGTLQTASQTNITAVGTLTGLTTSGAIVPSSNASVNIGSTSAYWNNVYAVNFLGTSTTAKYADLAERYRSDAVYEPGTVVDFGGLDEITLSNIDGSQCVAGVISTNPAYLMNDNDPDMLPVALMGRVPCKVTGPIRKGAMLVSAGDGTARMETNPSIGSVIGKALESFGDGIGVIEVVVGRL